MPIALKRIFEKEYKLKGMTKNQADRIFYAFENKRKTKARMRKKWSAFSL
jgi:hypothetical protein